MLRHIALLWGYNVKLLELDAQTDATIRTHEIGAARG